MPTSLIPRRLTLFVITLCIVFTIPLHQSLTQSGTSNISLSGFVDFYYGVNVTRPKERANALHVFDARANELTMSLVELVVQQPASPVGFRIDLDFGPTNDAVHYLDAGTTTNFAQQAYVTAVFPLGSGLTVDLGKFVTHMGLEVIESGDNWNYTRSILFGYAIPFFHVGARASYAVLEDITLTGHVYNGWDRGVTDNNNAKTFGATLNIATLPSTGIILNWIGGPELDDASDRLNVIDLIVSQTVSENFLLALNGDFGQTVTGSGTSVWKGIALYGKFVLNTESSLATRVELFSDRNGVRTGTVQTAKEMTFTYERVFADMFRLRGEYRHDFSNAQVFDGRKSQGTLLIGAIVNF
jgi:Putative beta-barrel porin-2, OmpL-like. bbp2